MHEVDYDEPFGPWLKRKLADAGLSQADVARRIGASTGMLAQWANGHRRPRPENARKLAAVLGVPADEMLTRLGYLPRRDREMHPKRAELLETARELPIAEADIVLGFMRWRIEEALRPRPRPDRPEDRRDTGRADDQGAA